MIEQGDSSDSLDKPTDVLDYLEEITLADIEKVIQGVAQGEGYDPKAGVVLIEMPDALQFRLRAGNRELQTLRCYAVKVNPGEKVRGHYHEHGAEMYGMPKDVKPLDARMYVGLVNDGEAVTWAEKPFRPEPGRPFTIHERQPHSLFNNAEQPFLFAVVCDPAHVAKGTGEIKEDRIFTTNTPDYSKI